MTTLEVMMVCLCFAPPGVKADGCGIKAGVKADGCGCVILMIQ